MGYMTASQAAEKWNISQRRVQILCSQNRIDGVFKLGENWAIPDNAKKPIDNRKKEINEMKNNKLVAIDLFCGCGGFSYGFQQAGFDMVLGIDMWKDATVTYQHNFPNACVINDDITNISADDILSRLGMNADDIDVIIGGPPCQGFSVSGKRMIDDPRNKLYKSFVGLVDQIRPKVFVMENVPGLIRLFGGKVKEQVLNDFSSLGYRVKVQQLSSDDYGVPQQRKREFFVGVNEKKIPTNVKFERERVIIVGIRNDLNDVMEYEFPKETNKNNWVPLSVAVPKLAIEQEKYYFSERAVQGMKNAKNNMKRRLYQDLNKPCLTVTSHLAKVSLNSRDPVLLVNPEKELYRRFTPLEAARIQSFPDEFIFAGSETDAYRQIGNAIPPVMFWHISDSIKRYLEAVGIAECKEAI